MNEIADRPDVVALSFGVTYWDDLGWKDTFASPQFTQRQWDYARFNGRGNVATPQVWLNGHTALVGSNARELNRDIASESSHGPSLTIRGRSVAIGAGSAPRGADVWLAHYDPHVLQVPIRAGENGGRTLPHKNIVRELIRVGRWSGRPEVIALPPAPHGLASAVFVQAGKGGPVLSAAKAL